MFDKDFLSCLRGASHSPTGCLPCKRLIPLEYVLLSVVCRGDRMLSHSVARPTYRRNYLRIGAAIVFTIAYILKRTVIAHAFANHSFPDVERKIDKCAQHGKSDEQVRENYHIHTDLTANADIHARESEMRTENNTHLMLPDSLCIAASVATQGV